MTQRLRAMDATSIACIPLYEARCISGMTAGMSPLSFGHFPASGGNPTRTPLLSVGTVQGFPHSWGKWRSQRGRCLAISVNCHRLWHVMMAWLIASSTVYMSWRMSVFQKRTTR